MSTRPFSIEGSKSFTMFDILVTDASGNTKEYGAQAGGGRLTLEQMAARIESHNLYPGAQKVTVRAATSQVPQMSVQKRLEEQRKKGLTQKVYTTPKVTVEKPLTPPVSIETPVVSEPEPTPEPEAAAVENPTSADEPAAVGVSSPGNAKRAPRTAK